MGGRTGIKGLVLAVLLVSLSIPAVGLTAESSDTSNAAVLKQIQHEIRQLRNYRARTDRELKSLRNEKARDDQVIQDLERKVDAIQAQSQKQEEATKQKIGSLEQRVSAGPNASQFSSAFGRYLGSHTFLLTGAAGFDFIFDQQSGALADLPHATQNTFNFNWEPMVLYRPADWILFEGELEAAFGPDGTGVDLPLADFQLYPNKYMTIVAGLFDQPFGDWYENQSPMWINRFATAPLPFGVAPVIPPGEAGLQIRHGFQWGKMGQDIDYTLWGGDGIGYSEPVPGAAVDSPTPVAFTQTNGKSIGFRLRVYPIPVEADMGRLEIGGSTYNGKWLDNHWFTSWGVDFNYLNGNFRARGEWVQSYRAMQSPFPNDNRQGWYVQMGYLLNGLNPSALSPQLGHYLNRVEALVRYSGVNQHYVALDDIYGATGTAMGGNQAGLVPDFGLTGSPALWAPHSREVALGLDYWIAPSIVWQNEFDIELPESGGVFVDGDGNMMPAGSIPNDKAFISQFTIGF